VPTVLIPEKKTLGVQEEKSVCSPIPT